MILLSVQLLFYINPFLMCDGTTFDLDAHVFCIQSTRKLDSKLKSEHFATVFNN